jgi:hypothetical protein
MTDRTSRDMLYSLLRRAYDGQVQRDIEGPEPLRWEGRLTLLAAVTPSVDLYASHADALGPRWLYLRLPETGIKQRREASRKAREGGMTLGEHRGRVRELTTAIVREACSRASRQSVGDFLGDALDDAALVACFGRAAVPRDGYGRREIIGLPTIEDPPRIAGQLDKLARALLALGLEEKDAAALCRRAALDSMPREQLACLDALADGEPASEAAGCAKGALPPTRRTTDARRTRGCRARDLHRCRARRRRAARAVASGRRERGACSSRSECAETWHESVKPTPIPPDSRGTDLRFVPPAERGR